MSFHDTLAYRQSDSGARNVLAVKAFERRKYAVVILGIDTAAIIADGKPIFLGSGSLGDDVNTRRNSGSDVFYSIPNQILE